MPWNQTTHSKFAVPMTAAPVAQRRMGFKALGAQKTSRSVAPPGFPRIQQVGSDIRYSEHGLLPGFQRIQQGGYSRMSSHIQDSEGGLCTLGGAAVQACQGNVSRKMLADNVCRKHLSLN